MQRLFRSGIVVHDTNVAELVRDATIARLVRATVVAKLKIALLFLACMIDDFLDNDSDVLHTVHAVLLDLILVSIPPWRSVRYRTTFRDKLFVHLGMLCSW